MKNRLTAKIQAVLGERFGSDFDEYESEASRIERKRNQQRSRRRRPSDEEEEEERPASLGQAISRFVFGKDDAGQQ